MALPDLAGLRVRENWREIEAGLRRRSARGWALLVLGLGLYLAIMLSARLLLPLGSQALIPVEYVLVHVFLYFPLPLSFALADQRRGRRQVLLWLAAALWPALLAALARGGALHPSAQQLPLPRVIYLLRTVVYPLGLGLWLTVLFGKRWQKSCPRDLAELGLVQQDARHQLRHLGMGGGAALVLLLHLCLTLLLSGYGQPRLVSPSILWRSGGFTLAQESLGEELFYRGFFFQYLRRLNWSFWPAALLVASTDAVHFLSLPSTLADLTRAVGLVYYVFVYSVINCFLIDRTKNLLAPWAANTLFTVGVLLLGL